VAARRRSSHKADALRAAGADHVVIDDDLPARVRAIWPDGPDWILELVGADTVLDSLQLVAAGGTVCTTGMLSGRWAVPEFEPVADIPSGTKLTAFHSADLAGQAGARALHEIVDGVLDRRYRAKSTGRSPSRRSSRHTRI
jgi:NADPH:quinone reductase-like Zn-dependent oxidoreductase